VQHRRPAAESCRRGDTRVGSRSLATRAAGRGARLAFRSRPHRAPRTPPSTPRQSSRPPGRNAGPVPGSPAPGVYADSVLWFCPIRQTGGRRDGPLSIVLVGRGDGRPDGVGNSDGRRSWIRAGRSVEIADAPGWRLHTDPVHADDRDIVLPVSTAGRKKEEFERILSMLGLDKERSSLWISSIKSEYSVADYAVPVAFASLLTALGSAILVFGEELKVTDRPTFSSRP
jgi:hypothetical protein